MFTAFKLIELAMWVKVALVIGGVLAAILLVALPIRHLIRAVSLGGVPGGYYLGQSITALVLAAAAFFGLSIGILAAEKQPLKAEAPPPQETASQQPEASPPPAEEQFEDTAFYVDLSDEDLLRWLSEQLGEDFDLYNDVRTKFDYSSLPSQQQARLAAVKAAMKTYYGKDVAPFTDPVAFPMDELIAELKSDDWSKLSADARHDWVRENVVKKYLYLNILRNPVYADMWLSWILEYAQEYPIITERSPWLLEFKAEIDAWFARTEAPVGWQNAFDPVKKVGDPKLFTQYYTVSCAKLIYLMDGFDLALEPVQTLTSSKNWHLPISSDANRVRTALCPEQESQPAVILEYRFKSGNTAMKGGANIFDGRAEIFEKKSPPAPVETPPPDEPEIGSPEPTPTPPPSNPTPPPSQPTPTPPAPTPTPTPPAPTPTPTPPTPTPTPTPPTPTPTPTPPAKNPDDSNGNQNPAHPGDDLQPGDGQGDYQPSEPPTYDTPPANSSPTPPDNSAGSDHRQEVNPAPITPSDPEDSSGLGGQDHPIQDENGGSTDNGNPPPKDEIPPVNDTTVTDTDGQGNQSTGNTGSDPVNEGTILPPD